MCKIIRYWFYKNKWKLLYSTCSPVFAIYLASSRSPYFILQIRIITIYKTACLQAYERLILSACKTKLLMCRLVPSHRPSVITVGYNPRSYLKYKIWRPTIIVKFLFNYIAEYINNARPQSSLSVLYECIKHSYNLPLSISFTCIYTAHKHYVILKYVYNLCGAILLYVWKHK